MTFRMCIESNIYHFPHTEVLVDSHRKPWKINTNRLKAVARNLVINAFITLQNYKMYQFIVLFNRSLDFRTVVFRFPLKVKLR